MESHIEGTSYEVSYIGYNVWRHIKGFNVWRFI